MSYKDLREHKHKTNMGDNDNGFFLQKCPFCKSTEMQIDARKDRGTCYNRNCTMYKRTLTTGEIETAVRKYL